MEISAGICLSICKRIPGSNNSTTTGCISSNLLSRWRQYFLEKVVYFSATSNIYPLRIPVLPWFPEYICSWFSWNPYPNIVALLQPGVCRTQVSVARTGRSAEAGNRVTRHPGWLFGYLRRIVDLFNENEQKNRPISNRRSRMTLSPADSWPACFKRAIKK